MSRAIDLPVTPREQFQRVWTKADRRKVKRAKRKKQARAK